MGRVFYNTQYSDYLGENRAILDIIVRNVPDVPSPTPSVTPSPTPTPSITPTRTVTPTVTATATVTPTVTTTPTITPSVSISPTATPTLTPTPTSSPGPAIDPDAQAFITATGISGVEATAINTLVLYLKSEGLWTLIDAFYPFVGGSASSCKFNLKDPQDTNEAYRMTFAGSWTIDSNGVKPSSKNSANYGDSHWSPNGVGGNRNDSHHIYRYINGVYNVGCDNSGVAGPYTLLSACAQLEWFDGGGSLTNGGVVSGTGGFSQGTSRTASNLVRFYRNLENSFWGLFGQLTNSATQSTNSMYIGTINGADYPEEMRYATLSYGQGLDVTQMSRLNIGVTDFNTTLGRNFNAV